MVRIITISREFGSGGRTVGKEVAACLGIPCYDRELIEKVAEETGYAREFVEEESEYAPSANDGPCVIVGRCADYILKDRSDCLHVFVYADKVFRAERIVKQYGETGVEPRKRLQEKDKKRKLNYKYFTDREWGKRENYHLSIDSGFFGIEKAVSIIVDAAGGAKENE